MGGGRINAVLNWGQKMSRWTNSWTTEGFVRDFFVIWKGGTAMPSERIRSTFDKNHRLGSLKIFSSGLLVKAIVGAVNFCRHAKRRMIKWWALLEPLLRQSQHYRRPIIDLPIIRRCFGEEQLLGWWPRFITRSVYTFHYKTRQSKQCRFCIHHRDNSLGQSKWSGFSSLVPQPTCY